MIVTENKVTHFDGKELTVFDALTGKTEKTLATDPSPWQFRGLRLFWLDKREEGEWKIKKVEETDFGGESPTRVRHFTLSSPKLENDLVITVRSKDGFVIDEYEVPSRPLPPDQLGGGAGQKTYYEGKFLDAEPAELNWKAPNRKEGR